MDLLGLIAEVRTSLTDKTRTAGGGECQIAEMCLMRHIAKPTCVGEYKCMLYNSAKELTLNPHKLNSRIAG